MSDSATKSASYYEQSRGLSIAALVFGALSCVSILLHCYLLYIRLSIPTVKVVSAFSSGMSSLLLICVLAVSDKDDYFTDISSYYEKDICSSTHSIRNAGYIMAICGVFVGTFVCVFTLFPLRTCAIPPGGETSTKGN
jgi:hypothetical protein